MVTMISTTFPGPRAPLADAAEEQGRTSAYWEWLDAVAFEMKSRGRTISGTSEGGIWVRLESAADADFEAVHMRHSIGHSWDKYSGIGDIFSLRDPDGLPQATVLVRQGVVVHAREHENARLSVRNMAALEDLASVMGWTIEGDTLPFDVLHDDAVPNTRVKYLLRSEGNAKAFGTVVLDGRLSKEQITDIARVVGPLNEFDPQDVGLERLGIENGQRDHEILSIRFVQDAPTTSMDAKTFHSLVAASEHEMAPHTPSVGQ